jgi:hypothetical protein
MAHYFFPSTESATDQITELFGFVWPTAAALWNLRWQVKGFLQEVDNPLPRSSTIALFSAVDFTGPI